MADVFINVRLSGFFVCGIGLNLVTVSRSDRVVAGSYGLLLRPTGWSTAFSEPEIVVREMLFQIYC
jgi:hypothetical protein